MPAHQVQVGRVQLRLDVLRVGRGRQAHGLRVEALHPAQQLGLGQAELGLGVARLVEQHVLVRLDGAAQVAAVQRVVRGGQRRVLGDVRCLPALGGRAGAGAADHAEALLGDQDQLVEDLADVRLVLGALEQRHQLAGHHGHHGRNALDAELLGDLRVGVHVDLGEHDPAGVLLGQPLQDGAQLLARAAPLGPEVDDHRYLGGALDDLLLEGVLGDVDDERVGRAGRGDPGLLGGRRLAGPLGPGLLGLLGGLAGRLHCCEVDGTAQGGAGGTRIPWLHGTILPRSCRSRVPSAGKVAPRWSAWPEPPVREPSPPVRAGPAGPSSGADPHPRLAPPHPMRPLDRGVPTRGCHSFATSRSVTAPTPPAASPSGYRAT